MPQAYKGVNIPALSDAADAPQAFRNLVDSGGTIVRGSSVAGPVAGMIRWNSPNFEYYSGTQWLPLYRSDGGPRGVVAFAKRTSDYTAPNIGSNVGQDVPGLSVQFTASADRRYRTHVRWGIVEIGTPAIYIVNTILSGNNSLISQVNYLFGNMEIPMDNVVIESGLSGTVTRKSRLALSDSTVQTVIGASSTIQTFICVEDIGPA